ncbi:MAG: sigma-70 family RNA polymerase sigma factor [Roseivirga sp.]|nr:sigma-70 family RNA polymerase sigma factor [Roseivirga sp.]
MTILEERILDHLQNELQTSSLEFQTELKNQYPKLTPYDLRLCTYLKANLSTKEMATLLNITPDSVKKAKHRLRKKLAIEPRESILSRFSTLPG